MSRALILRHVDVEGPGRIASALAEAGISSEVVATGRGEALPDDLTPFSALVVMGGPMGVYEEDTHPFLREERRLIREALAKEIPTLGVCLGSQLLAAALGAEVRPSGGWELGFHDVRLREGAARDPLFREVPATFAPLHWHGDVFDLPEGAISLASSQQTEHQAFRYGDFAWGLLFHLEATAEHVRAMANAFPHDVHRANLEPSRLLAMAEASEAALDAIASHVFGAFAARITER